jgi:hypothetical protein
MPHPRATLRKAFADRLTDSTGAEGRVYAARLAPITLDLLKTAGPAVLVYVVEEDIDLDDYPTSGADGSVMRTLKIAVEGIALGSGTVDDILDDLAAEIEERLESWDVAELPMAELRLISTDIDISDAFERPVGSVMLTYHVRYPTPFRPDNATFLPDDLYSSPFGQQREILADGPGNDG